MATAVKHMERSRRSYRSNAAAMNYFKSKAYRNSYDKALAKTQQMSIGQMLAGAVRRMMPRGEK